MTQTENDSLPTSTNHSHINSPAGSISPAPILGSSTEDASLDQKPNGVFEMRSHLSQFALNSGPSSATSSNRGSLPPSTAVNGSWVDQESAGNGGMVQQQRQPNSEISPPPVIRPPGQLIRGRPAEQSYSNIDLNIAANRPPEDEAEFKAFLNIVLSQPTQMGFNQQAIREAWTNHGGDNKAAFDYLAKAFSQRTQQGSSYLAQQQAQHQMRQQHAQQQAQYQLLQQAQYNWNVTRPGQAFPMAQYQQQQAAAQSQHAQQRTQQYGQYQGQYPNGQYSNGYPPQQGRQQQFPSPYAQQRTQPQQQLRGNQVNRTSEQQRPRPQQPYNASYAPPRATVIPRYAQPLPPAGPLRKRKAAASDSDGEENYSDNSGDEYGGPTPAQMVAKNARAMSFFNECTKDELTELACE